MRVCLLALLIEKKLCFYISCHVGACCISRRLDPPALIHDDGRNPSLVRVASLGMLSEKKKSEPKSDATGPAWFTVKRQKSKTNAHGASKRVTTRRTTPPHPRPKSGDGFCGDAAWLNLLWWQGT